MLGFSIIVSSVAYFGPEISETNHIVILIKANANGLSFIRGEKSRLAQGPVGWGRGGRTIPPRTMLAMIRMGTWYSDEGPNTAQPCVWAEEQPWLPGRDAHGQWMLWSGGAQQTEYRGKGLSPSPRPSQQLLLRADFQ